MDPYFKVVRIAAIENPNQLMWKALHQDYSENFVSDETPPSEKRSGEIVVERLLNGNRGHYGCYSEDTEVLTSNGWMPWPLVFEDGASVKLLAVDTESGSAKFEHPEALQRYKLEPSDKLYSVSSAYINLLVTQDHRMVVSHRKKTGGFSGWYFKQAHEVYERPVRYLLNCCLDQNSRSVPSDIPENVDAHTALKLAGFFFGDGLRTNNKDPETVRFRIRRPRKIAYLLSLDLPTSAMKGDRYTIRHKALGSWIHKYFSSSTGKTVPSWLLTLPAKLIASFWDGLKNSDGTRISEKSWCYDSCEKVALDIIQATAHVNGFSANMTLNNPNEGIKHINHRPCWRLHISERSTYRVETSQEGRSLEATESLVSYSGYVYCASVSTGALLVRRQNKAVVSGNCLEHPQIIFNVGYFPHSIMQQVRTHRLLSFDVQSFRYSGKRIVDVANGDRNVEEVFYLRPLGKYHDRSGKSYNYTQAERDNDLADVVESAKKYRDKITSGMAEEHARGTIPFDTRQHWVMSGNLRSILHLLDLRWKKDAQIEVQQLCNLIFPHIEEWVPTIAEWYLENRAKKAILAP